VKRLAFAVVVLALAAAAVAKLTDGPGERGAWAALPEPPLSPREMAVGAWTGREVILVGGSDAPPCPPNASCEPSGKPPLRDGAAYDPRERAWRKIAPAPVGFDFADTATVAGVLFVLTSGNESRPGSPRAFLSYDPQADRWRRLRPPPDRGDSPDFALVAGGRHLVAHRAREILLYDPSGDRWAAQPSPGGEVQLVWTGADLAALARGRIARSALPVREWRTSRIAGLRGPGAWVSAGSRLIDATLGAGDSDDEVKRPAGGAEPNGGIVHLDTRRWSRLPDPPSDNHWQGGAVLTAGALHHGHPDNWVFDATRDEWFKVPPRSGDDRPDHATYVSAGRELLAFGGVRWRGLEGTLLNAADIWRAG
jgi:hypothetical protein